MDGLGGGDCYILVPHVITVIAIVIVLW
uniref:Uncharacterized protein n=1 Tax=Anguilla anguilla TaxID=7936 RepID=A0A0E9V304_ANGAN